MFSNIGWSEAFVLIIAALVILGPERLPGAIRWVSGTLRKVKDYASGASTQLKQEFGSDFEEFRKPIQQLNELRGMSPRAMVTKHLLDGDDSVIRDFEDTARSVKEPLKPSSPMYEPKPDNPNPPAPGSPPPVDFDAT
ncbi:MAG: Sec-independent protein translocase protein TatB [Nocardiaceae bacterium]|nr:Sec-independent protein translocase protein TatB [Nocardiaceae bacterium]